MEVFYISTYIQRSIIDGLAGVCAWLKGGRLKIEEIASCGDIGDWYK